MHRVIVTVKAPFQAHALDLEVPATVPAALLAELLVRELAEAGQGLAGAGEGLTGAGGAEAGGSTAAGGYALAASPPGRLLRPDETLADAGVWTGAWLLLVKRQGVVLS